METYSETYSEKMSKKIMSATDAALAEISDDMEMEVYEQLAPEARTKLDRAYTMVPLGDVLDAEQRKCGVCGETVGEDVLVAYPANGDNAENVFVVCKNCGHKTEIYL